MTTAKASSRLAAYLLDFVITGITMLVVYFIFSFDIIFFVGKGMLNMDVKTAIHFFRVTFINVLLVCSYFTLIPYLLDGQTLGKKIFRIKVVNERGEKASLKRLFIREIFGKFLLNFVSFFFGHLISFILLESRNDKKSIADILAATIVVDVEKKK